MTTFLTLTLHLTALLDNSVWFTLWPEVLSFLHSYITVVHLSLDGYIRAGPEAVFRTQYTVLMLLGACSQSRISHAHRESVDS